MTAVLKALELRSCFEVRWARWKWTVEEEDVVTTASKGGQYNEIWEVTDIQKNTCPKRRADLPISVDWIDVNKADESRQELCSRLVQEAKLVYIGTTRRSMRACR